MIWMKGRKTEEDKIILRTKYTTKNYKRVWPKDDEKIEKFPLSNLHEGKKRIL